MSQWIICEDIRQKKTNGEHGIENNKAKEELLGSLG